MINNDCVTIRVTSYKWILFRNCWSINVNGLLPETIRSCVICSGAFLSLHLQMVGVNFTTLQVFCAAHCNAHTASQACGQKKASDFQMTYKNFALLLYLYKKKVDYKGQKYNITMANSYWFEWKTYEFYFIILSLMRRSHKLYYFSSLRALIAFIFSSLYICARGSPYLIVFPFPAPPRPWSGSVWHRITPGSGADTRHKPGDLFPHVRWENTEVKICCIDKFSLLTFPLRDLEVVILECLVVRSRVGLVSGVGILK